jgi:hypothetical protein
MTLRSGLSRSLVGWRLSVVTEILRTEKLSMRIWIKMISDIVVELSLVLRNRDQGRR